MISYNRHIQRNEIIVLENMWRGKTLACALQSVHEVLVYLSRLLPSDCVSAIRGYLLADQNRFRRLADVTVHKGVHNTEKAGAVVMYDIIYQ